MIKVAITGNIASGKSCVEKFIREAGYIVIDTDKINSDILSEDLNTINKIKECFKEDDICTNNGQISKDKLGGIVFSNADKKKCLEEILHKQIKTVLEDIFSKNKEEKVIFVSVPLLFESGFNKDYDKIIFIYAPDEIRLKRLIERNGYTKEYALKRLKAQDSQEDKIKKSDYIILNISDMENLKNQLNLILKQISSLY